MAKVAKSAGEALRERLDADLAARGPGWEWTALDSEVIASAVRHADRAEQLQRVYDETLSGDSPSVSALARLAAEIRHQERRVLELVSQLTAPGEVPKSPRHQAAVNARWRRKREREAARVVPIREVVNDA